MAEQELLNLLTRRVERLNEEYFLKAPTIIKKTEIKLILDFCRKLFKIYK